MQILKTKHEVREKVLKYKRMKNKIGLVATMGNLHDGHLKLIEEAKKYSDLVVATIFINPTQFDKTSDLDNYPKTIEADCEKLENLQTDLVFIPNVEELYPNSTEYTFVEVPFLSDILEGELRPNHFRGVASVVTRLFNIIQPDVAIFGEKDYQQVQVIKKLIQDLCYNIKVVTVPTVRAGSELALSSRNNHLTRQQLATAPLLFKTMKKLANKIECGENNIDALIKEGEEDLEKNGFQLDGIHIVDAETLVGLTACSKQLVVLMSAFLGEVRLIDNIVINLR